MAVVLRCAAWSSVLKRHVCERVRAGPWSQPLVLSASNMMFSCLVAVTVCHADTGEIVLRIEGTGIAASSIHTRTYHARYLLGILDLTLVRNALCNLRMRA